MVKFVDSRSGKVFASQKDLLKFQGSTLGNVSPEEVEDPVILHEEVEVFEADKDGFSEEE